MRIIDEIRAVGLRDWYWFVFVLKRNEFSYKLDMFRYHEKHRKDWANRLIRDRMRAHEIDMILLELEYKKRAA